MKLGMIDLDTSHPASWLVVLGEMGHEVTCVFDGGTVYPEGYAREFADAHGIDTVCGEPGEMVGKVDAAIVHSCNWELHLERARPFVEADIPVLIDKPVVGNVADALTLIDWAESGKVITGGSSLRWCFETQELLAQPESERGKIHLAFTGCSVDAFNYGIHAYAQLAGIMGPGVSSTRWLGGHVQDQVELVWSDGRRGVVTVGETDGYLPMYATVITTKKVVHFEADPKRIYRALLEHELPILSGEVPPGDVRELLAPELAAIAALVSKGRGGERVLLKDLSPEQEGYDGRAFARAYREKRLPKYLESRKEK